LKASILTDHPSLKIHLVHLDIQSNLDIKSSIAALPKEFTPIHVLVNNAGLGLGSDPVAKLNVDDFDTMLNTNVKGLLFMAQAVLPQMMREDAG
jgi:3-hydroxy acid dehydrogenase / malonic semialdehyde reductase